MSAAENRDLVLRWFASGRDVDGTMLASDFVWHTPKGTADLLNGGNPDFYGDEAFGQLDAVARSAYRTPPEPEMVFCIAEDDWVVMQLNVATTSHDGEVYENVYALTVRCEDGQIAELWEHADTKLWWDTIVGTAERRAAFEKRFADEKRVELS